MFSKSRAAPTAIRVEFRSRQSYYFRIENAGGTDIEAHLIGPYGTDGIEVSLGGDCELETIITALKFITKVLEDGATEVND